MTFDPATVTLDQLEKRDLLSVPAAIVGRYERAVVVEHRYTASPPKYTVYAFSAVDTGPYDKPVHFAGLDEEWAHQMARDWTKLAD